MEIHAQDDIAKWYLVDSCTFHTTFTVKCPSNTRSVLAKTGECQSGYVLYYMLVIVCFVALKIKCLVGDFNRLLLYRVENNFKVSWK